MKYSLHGLTILLLLLFFTTFSYSQQNLFAPCPEGVDFPLPGLNCEDAPILCDLGEISGYCAQMVPPPATGNQPNPLCGNGFVNNIIWFGFVASGPNVQIDVFIENCTVTANNETGVQYGIYVDCSFDEWIVCNDGSNTGNVSFGQGETFESGHTYYVFMDGYDGSVCQITVDIVEGAGMYEVADPSDVDNDFLPLSFDPPFAIDEVCQGGEIAFTAEVEASGETQDYWWTIDPPTVDYPNGIITVPDGDESSNGTFDIFIDLSEIGTFEICGYAYTGCDTSLIACQIIEVVPLPGDELEDFNVCFGDYPSSGPPEWLGPIITGPGDYSVAVEEPTFSCDYTQTLTVHSIPFQPDVTVIDVVCGPVTEGYQVCDMTIYGDQNASYVTCEGADVHGCDSNIVLTLAFIDVIGTLMDPVCEDGQLLFSWIGVYPNSDFNTQVTFNLYRDNFLVFTADGASFNPFVDVMPVDIEDGSYYLEVEVVKYGKLCFFSSNIITIFVDNLLPEEPFIDVWALNPCVQDSTSYELGIGVDPTLIYLWDVSPSNGLVVADDSSTVIGINWQTANPNLTYTICVTADNGCGLSVPFCEEVELLSQPIASYDIADTMCVTDLVALVYDGSVITSGDYNWNFDGGDIGGANSNSPGPFNIGFATTGKKYITVNVNQGTCESETFLDSVIVVAPLPEPLVNCGSETDSIGFSWDDIADDYIVTVINAPGTAVFVENGTSFSVTNLVPNDEVTIELTAVDDGPCGDVITTITCIAQNCAPVDISIDPIDTICLDANAGTIDLNAIINPILPNAVESWSGDGIVDSDDGIFDPAIALAGVHQIVFSYETDCPYSQSMNIVVLEQPVSTFTTEDTICIEDFVTINYTGTFSTGEFEWEFDGGIATGSGAGPFDISWDTPGLKTISAVVGNGDCISELFSKTVLVEDSLSSPIINCVENTNDISFSWDPVNNATLYEVFINGESQGIQSSTTFFVDDLEPGNMIDITIVAFSDNKCPSVTSFTSCIALNCPVVIMSLSTNNPIICLTDDVDPVTIENEIIGGADEADISWIGDGVDQNGIFDATIAGVGEHEIILEYTNLNCTQFDTIVMTVLPTPEASFFTSDVICVSDSFIVEFDGTFQDVAELEWDLNGGSISGDFPGPYTVWFNSPGVYDIELEVSEEGCLSAPFIQTVTVEDELHFPVNEGFTCISTTDSINFTWPSVDCASEYIVFINGIEQETTIGTSFFASGLDDDVEVIIEIIAISDCACGDQSFSTTCETDICPEIDLEFETIDPICFDDGDIFELIIDESGASGFEEVTWIGLGVDQNGMFDPKEAGVGVHQIIYALTNSNCNYNTTIDIEIFPSPEAEILFNDPTCPGEEDGTIEINAMGGDGDFTIFVNGDQIESNVLAGLSGNNYTIEVFDGNNCGYSEVVSLISPTIQNIEINGYTDIISGDTSEYFINSNIPSESITDIVWMVKDSIGSIVLCQGVDCDQIDFGPENDATLCVQITYGDGCFVENCIDIRSEKIKQIFIPNIFSPNEDGVNDVFNIFPNDEVVSLPLIQIFNRWGEKMFEAENLALDGTAPGWAGRFKGANLNPGVYVYVLYVVYIDGTTETINGDITIIK